MHLDDHDPPAPYARLDEALAGLAGADVDMPHVVVSSCPRTGTATISGPYPSVMEALVAAEIEAVTNRVPGEGDDLSFGVAALYPPMAVGVQAADPPRLDGSGQCRRAGTPDDPAR